MKYISALIICVGIVLGFGVANVASANEVTIDTVAQPHHHYDVYYHTDRWQHRHFSDHHAQHRFMNALRNLGCLVREQGHFVYYHCPQERYRHFTHHSYAHNFQNQMRRLGFHTHIHH